MTSVEKKERSGTFQEEPKHLLQEHLKKGEEDVLLCIVVPYPIRYRIRYVPYPLERNSYSHCINGERRGRCSVIIIIPLVPIGQYLIHRTRHTTTVVTWHPCTKSSVPTWYHYIEQSTASLNWSYMLTSLYIPTPSYITINSSNINSIRRGRRRKKGNEYY